MFCFQCEQTRRTETGGGCAHAVGACGKDETTSDLQDLLIHQLKGIAWLRTRLVALGGADRAADSFTLLALFTTLTNVNFDPARFVALIAEAATVRDRLRAGYEAACRAAGKAAEPLAGPAAFCPADTLPGLLAQAAPVGVLAGIETVGPDVIGLRSLLLYGLKGVAAYAWHAEVLGERRDAVADGVAHVLDMLAGDPTDPGAMLQEALALGRCNFTAMEALDAGNTTTFGSPAPTAVRITPVAGKAILVSGHDLHDLAAILEATAGTGINVYTHGELLPAHGYPKLSAHPHLVGNYGGAWQDQQREFAAFPGPIVMTSNCLIEPQPAYRDRVFTLGPVAWPGLRALAGGDFSAVIAQARVLPGFAVTAPERSITVGFGREAVLGVAGKVVDAVKQGALKHFFLIGGCDGAKPGRNYFTEFAEQVPADSMVLTLGCGKYRFNTHDFGTVAGLPRLLDIGQCNDTYSALVIAQALAGAFECGVNELPLTLIVSWFEQKAVAVLLTLLALGVRNIRLGPTLPKFLTPALVEVLVGRFGITTIGEPSDDLEAALACPGHDRRCTGRVRRRRPLPGHTDHSGRGTARSRGPGWQRRGGRSPGGRPRAAVPVRPRHLWLLPCHRARGLPARRAQHRGTATRPGIRGRSAAVPHVPPRRRGRPGQLSPVTDYRRRRRPPGRHRHGRDPSRAGHRVAAGPPRPRRGGGCWRRVRPRAIHGAAAAWRRAAACVLDG